MKAVEAFYSLLKNEPSSSGEDALTLLLAGRPSWWADARCREPRYAYVEFFTERGEDVRPAKAVCAACLVQPECLAFALDGREKFGVWGGKSERERRQLRKGRRRAA